jgi:ABC-2 type transport system ATP-binding protein
VTVAPSATFGPMAAGNRDRPAIRTEGLTKRFGDFTALDSLTLDVAEGEVFGFLGPNGAGKSTTLRLLLGLIKPTAGRAEIKGIDVARTKEVHHHLAYVPGDVSLWPRLTGEECLTLFGRLQGGVDGVYQRELIDRFELDLTKRARTYSKGNRQKVALVAAFSRRPDVLLLDEPTSGLDPLMEQQFRRCVHEATERGQTIFLSSHILSEVEDLCVRVGILRNGTLVEVSAVESLRRLHSSQLDIDVHGEPPDLAGVAGVESVERTPNGVRVQLSGPPGPVLAAFGANDIIALRSQEASLEEIFLAYYGGQADDDARRPS